MDMDLKQMLHDKIDNIAPLYGLTDICFPSFTRHYGYEHCLSASDVVYALATLLETSPAAATRLGEKVEWNEEEDWGTIEKDDGEELGSVRRAWWMRNFYTAYDALGMEEPDLLLHGLKLCMKIQKVVVEQGTDILVKKMAKSLKNFRFVNIRNSADLPIFQHPLTLGKLASFLIDAYRVRGGILKFCGRKH
jgi:cell division control protein 45